ncbi:DUF3795 domain-containing protein [uncultured Methanolobus sp.]|uniref:DUF3795 domain-containing protein n=1 Tax=uncultured Methanolobus sp. TaxID=218300 RepID=UPI0029C8D0B6
MSIRQIVCCGAYCKTCRPFKDGACLGCKPGYDTGERDISKAKCKIKICCIKREYNTCADCPEINSCPTINEFYTKNGYKYGKCKQVTQFIRENE